MHIGFTNLKYMLLKSYLRIRKNIYRSVHGRLCCWFEMSFKYEFGKQFFPCVYPFKNIGVSIAWPKYGCWENWLSLTLATDCKLFLRQSLNSMWLITLNHMKNYLMATLAPRMLEIHNICKEYYFMTVYKLFWYSHLWIKKGILFCHIIPFCVLFWTFML